MFFTFERYMKVLKEVSMWRFIKDYPFSIIFVLVVAYLSLSQPPKVMIPLFRNWDKVVHFCMYGGLSGVIWIEFLLKHRKKKAGILFAVLGPVLCPIVIGGIMELCQRYFTRYRSGDLIDFMANMTGVLVATLIALFVLRPLIMKKPIFQKNNKNNCFLK